jgi:hypothetical protein
MMKAKVMKLMIMNENYLMIPVVVIVVVVMIMKKQLMMKAIIMKTTNTMKLKMIMIINRRQ